QASGCGVPGNDEQDAVGDGVGACVRVVRELLRESGEQVVAGCGAALVEAVAEVRLQLGRGVARGLEECDVALVRESLPEGDHLPVDPTHVLAGDAEHAQMICSGRERANSLTKSIRPRSTAASIRALAVVWIGSR